MAKKKNKSTDDGVVCTNRKARHDYSIEETVEAGLVLRGDEVKSLRARQVSLAEAYGRIDNGEAWLVGCRIQPYENASHLAPDPTRPKKLLMHHREIERLAEKTREQGWTLVALKIYFTGRGLAKVTIGLAAGKRQHDRRQDIMARQAKRETDRALKNATRS